MSFLNFAEPVTFVRSPTFTKFVSGPTGRGSRRGSASAAAANDGEEPRFGELAENSGRVRGRLVVLAHLVRQSRIGMHARPAGRHAREFLDVRAQVLRAERAVEADGERLRMRDGVPEGLGGLSRERAAAGVGD